MNWQPNKGWQRGSVRPMPDDVLRLAEGLQDEPNPYFASKPMTGWQCAMFALLMLVIFGLAVVA